MMDEERKRVLCVEDNADECDLVREILSNYEVVCAPTISEANTRLTDDTFDLIIIDEHLLDGSGMELCRHITETSREPSVIMITGDPYITELEVKDSGAEALLTKGSNEYFDRLRRLANRLVLAAVP
jgi:two-component system response regulator MtrA